MDVAPGRGFSDRHLNDGDAAVLSAPVLVYSDLQLPRSLSDGVTAGQNRFVKVHEPIASFLAFAGRPVYRV